MNLLLRFSVWRLRGKFSPHVIYLFGSDCCYGRVCISVYVELIHSIPACRFNEFGTDGGPAAKSLSPKFDIFTKHVSVQTGLQVPEVEVRNLLVFPVAITLAVSLQLQK